MKICTSTLSSLSNNLVNEAELSPKESTIQAILDFAASYNEVDTLLTEPMQN